MILIKEINAQKKEWSLALCQGLQLLAIFYFYPPVIIFLYYVLTLFIYILLKDIEPNEKQMKSQILILDIKMYSKT